MRKMFEIISPYPLPGIPELGIKIRAVRIGGWCFGWNSNKADGLCFVGAWRYGEGGREK